MPWRNLPEPLSPPPGSPRRRKELQRSAPPQRTSSLRRVSLKRSRRRTVRPDEPGRAEWKAPQSGYCSCGCNRFAMHLERHHVVALEVIRRESRPDLAFDLRNGMLLHPRCHSLHTDAVRRLRRASLPAAAVLFASELLGVDRAGLYLARFYAAERLPAEGL